MVMGKEYKQLTVREREKIAFYYAQRKSVREIARLLARNHSTISRELRRNRCPVHWTDYRPYRAQLSAEKRNQISRTHARLKNDRIRDYVEEKLKQGWSPEQISGRISIDRPGLRICYEAIYQWLYTEAKHLILSLARRHRRRYKRPAARKHQRLRIPERVSIEQRPQEINQRLSFGHWEADSMVSKSSQGAIHVLVERKSRFVKISKLLRNCAPAVRKAILRKLSYQPAKCRQTITYDNGLENIQHQEINKILKTQSYFCNPYHSWEKGSVENTNGLIRRFIPKKSNLQKISSTDLYQIENLLNNRPRKCLKYKTPKEVYIDLTGALTH